MSDVAEPVATPSTEVVVADGATPIGDAMRAEIDQMVAAMPPPPPERELPPTHTVLDALVALTEAVGPAAAPSMISLPATGHDHDAVVFLRSDAGAAALAQWAHQLGDAQAWLDGPDAVLCGIAQRPRDDASCLAVQVLMGTEEDSPLRTRLSDAVIEGEELPRALDTDGDPQ